MLDSFEEVCRALDLKLLFQMVEHPSEEWLDGADAQSLFVFENKG